MIPSPELIRRYNVSGPRYTSYPTAIDFTAGRSADERLEQVRRHLTRISPLSLADDKMSTGSLGGRKVDSRPLSLYIHLPFCASLCWYCGCTKVITRDTGRADTYLDDLEREMRIYADRMDVNGPVVQIHFGGGTPTFLTPEQLLRLGGMIRSRFRLADEVEFSVEIDPRRCGKDRIEALREIGCNRASLGVQDTDTEVQKAIHRIQPFGETRQVAEWLRETGIGQINLDLIYGLPRQTPDRFSDTLDRVLTLEPDRLALYSYAHLPDRLPSQRLIRDRDLPSPEAKLEMFLSAAEKLTTSGLHWIGMDHFAREEDDLTRALEEGTLQRNFQGYSTHAETDLIGLGMSGISQLESLYYQNEKDLETYSDSIRDGRLPVARVIRLTREDQMRRDLIMQVMCRRELFWHRFMEQWGVDPVIYFQSEIRRLKPLEEDGLVRIGKDRLEITETGRFFLRNIAMVFDNRLPSVQAGTFSRTV